MTRIKKLTELLPKEIDCALITSDINRRYFTGMKSSAGVVAVFRDKAYLIIDFRYFEKALATVDTCEVIQQANLTNQLKSLCEKHKAKTIAVETHTMTIHELESYKKTLSAMDFDTSDHLSDLITGLRAIKDSEELEKIKEAQRIAEKAFDNVLNYIQVGKTEKEIAFILDSFMLQNGAEALSFDTIALFGKNTSLPHGVPSNEKLCNGEFILMDFGAVYEGYHSDMTRTVCIGEPSDKMRSVYDIVLQAQHAALQAAHAGIKGHELDEIARNVISSNGYGEQFGHSLGHGVGMEIHEFPNAAPKNQTIFQENMVMTVEPGIYLTQEFGVRIEDFVVIKNGGCENMTKSLKNLLCL